MKERLLWTFVIVIILLFVIQKVRPQTEADKKIEWTRLWIYKTHGTKKYDCIIYGDSRVYRGISASVVEKKIGISAFNFGYSSGSFSSFMLDKVENKLNTESDLPIVLLGITPYSLTPKASEDEHIKQELARKKEEILEYLYFEPVKRFFAPLSIDILKTKKQAKDTVVVPYYFQESNVNEGWVASWKIPADPKAALPGYVKDFSQNTVSQAAIDTLMNRVQIWTSKGIKVFGFRPPTTIEMVELENNLSGFNEIQFVSRFRKAGGVWLEVDNNYESYDGSHLTKSSAIKVSEKLGALIVQYTSQAAAN